VILCGLISFKCRHACNNVLLNWFTNVFPSLYFQLERSHITVLLHPSVPMFRDLVSKSPRCKKTTQKVFLKDIATMARQMDRDNQRQPTSLQVPKPLNISGVVFHESRCGSTLVANSLIGMNPTQHRVYSESPPPVTAMRICGEDYSLCSKQQAAAILRDTLYMMSRTNDPKEQRVFFKIQSVGSRHIEVFREAFPDTPWIFVYREPVQVMMSHLKYGIRRANCLRSHHNPPPVTQNLIKRHGRDNTAQLSPQEFCAAHLATITESAMENLRQTNYGVPVNYASLPAILYETILPHHMGIPTTATEIHNILQVSSQYSKGRDDKKAEWQEDSTEKEKAASREIRQAAKEFMTESFAALEEFGGAKLKTLQA